MVTYDVYLGTTNPPPIVSEGEVNSLYDPGYLEYETTYYWSVETYDSYGLSTGGQVWEFTTGEEPIWIPDLYCTGNLDWSEVTPGDNVTGTISVENIGDTASFLNWEVDSYPEWGTWTFTPETGENLMPDAPITVDVEVVAPEDKESEFAGQIVLVNMDDPADTCTIDVSLVTPMSQSSLIIQFLEILAERYPVISLILELLL